LRNSRNGSRTASTPSRTKVIVSLAWRSRSGAARAAILSPTGAIATSVSTPASAMMTVLDGTLCAPMALRTI
jgi:hypothetical protein